MLSLKRLVYIILIVAVVGALFLLYSQYGSRTTAIQSKDPSAQERTFVETRQIAEGDKPRAWVFGDAEAESFGDIRNNVLQLCEDMHLVTFQKDRFDADEVRQHDLVVFCDAALSHYANASELEEFVEEGGRVLFAAGIGSGEEEFAFWPMLGLEERMAEQDCHELAFEKPLLPLQPEKTGYAGSSHSAQLEVDPDASVYLRDAESGTPLLYTRARQEGSVCLINGEFLADAEAGGLFTGATCALMPDFIYPILGVKVVFLDGLFTAAAADDELCRQTYGYSANGFLQNVVWPLFQGMSLRANAPLTSSLLVEAPSGEAFAPVDKDLIAEVGASVLQFNGELIYAADLAESGKIVIDEESLARFSEAFANYTVRGLALEAGDPSSEVIFELSNELGADIRAIRGMLDAGEVRFLWEDGRFVFPAATKGADLDDGGMFEVCSVLGAYGMVSHVFDISTLSAWEGPATAWETDKEQIELFESEILSGTPWLESKTLLQVGDEVKSYQDMEYDWTVGESQVKLELSGVVVGQAFMYHTKGRIANAEGLDYEEIGNGYYVLHVREPHAAIVLEEGI